MDLQLTDHVVIVTGGTTGIGLATVNLLVEEGAIPVVVARGSHGTEHLPERADIVHADLTDPDSCTRLVETTLERHGRLDGLVNNAAAFGSHESMAAFDEDLWRRVFDLNLFAVARLSAAVLPVMAAQNGGSIVHLGSEAAHIPDPSMIAYAASKTALLAYSKALTIEGGPTGVRSNVLSPGPTRTDQFEAPGRLGDELAERFGVDRQAAIDHFIREVRGLPTGRIGEPHEVAAVILFLLSPRTRQVTGAEWSIDGGALREI